MSEHLYHGHEAAMLTEEDYNEAIKRYLTDAEFHARVKLAERIMRETDPIFAFTDAFREDHGRRFKSLAVVLNLTDKAVEPDRRDV